MIELRHLRHLLALAHHGNFSRAAEELRLTQPALSRSIQTLEALVGASLFERNRSGIEPTDMGRLLLRHAQAVDSSARDLDRAIELAQGLQVGELRIGVGPWGASVLAGAAIGRLNHLHPRVRIQVISAPRDEMPDRLRRREVDVVVVGLPHFADQPDVTIQPLAEHPVPFLCRAGHPLTQRDSLSTADLFAYPLAGPTIPALALARLTELAPPEMLAEPVSRGDSPRLITIDCQSVALLKEILLHSDALAPMPDFMAAGELADGRLVKLPAPDLGLKAHFAAVWLTQRSLSAAGRKFIDLLVQYDPSFALPGRSDPAA